MNMTATDCRLRHAQRGVQCGCTKIITPCSGACDADLLRICTPCWESGYRGDSPCTCHIPLDPWLQVESLQSDLAASQQEVERLKGELAATVKRGVILWYMAKDREAWQATSTYWYETAQGLYKVRDFLSKQVKDLMAVDAPEVERLRAALKQYGWHLADCKEETAWHPDKEQCSCGFAALLTPSEPSSKHVHTEACVGLMDFPDCGRHEEGCVLGIQSCSRRGGDGMSDLDLKQEVVKLRAQLEERDGLLRKVRIAIAQTLGLALGPSGPIEGDVPFLAEVLADLDGESYRCQEHEFVHEGCPDCLRALSVGLNKYCPNSPVEYKWPDLSTSQQEVERLRAALRECQALAATHQLGDRRLTALEATAEIAGIAKRALLTPSEPSSKGGDE